MSGYFFCKWGNGVECCQLERARGREQPPAGAGIFTLPPFEGHVGNALSTDTGEDAGKEEMEVPETPGKAGLYCWS